MIAQKYEKKIKISPHEAERYMADNYLLLDDEENLLDDPLNYAKEQIKKISEQQKIEIPIPDINAIKQIQADVQYIAMCSDVEL